jgi:two-component system, NarL family, sensor kinase
VAKDIDQLPGRLLKLYDDERRNIARELHDTTAQNLAALSMNLMMLGSAFDDRERAAAILQECNALTEECLKEVRSLSYTLYPPLLDELGLNAALRSFVELFQRSSGIAVQLQAATVPRLPLELELAAFRIAQEALLNTHQHSGSKRAEIELATRNSQIEVAIRDWGKGIENREAHQNGLGITGMTERARLLGGTVVVEPAHPGTRVRAVFPIRG